MAGVDCFESPFLACTFVQLATFLSFAQVICLHFT